MKLRAILCVFFGHKPEQFEYDDGIKTTTFDECCRCHARKNLTGQGWIHDCE